MVYHKPFNLRDNSNHLMGFENFTYEVPNESNYYSTLLEYLKNKHTSLYDCMKNGYCEFQQSSKYIRSMTLDGSGRWDAYTLWISFYLDMQDLVKADVFNETLKEICQLILPDNCGYDILEIKFAPMIKNYQNDAVDQNLEEVKKLMPSSIDIPAGIHKKALHMAECYLYVYYVENILRKFIDNILTKKFDDDYPLKIKQSIKDKIDTRKKSLKKWQSQRGDKDIYYTDLIELSNIIISYWDIFKIYFDEQNELKMRLNDIAACRNNIAHNTYLDDSEKRLIISNFEIILKEIKSAFKNN